MYSRRKLSFKNQEHNLAYNYQFNEKHLDWQEKQTTIKKVIWQLKKVLVKTLGNPGVWRSVVFFLLKESIFLNKLKKLDMKIRVSLRPKTTQSLQNLNFKLCSCFLNIHGVNVKKVGTFMFLMGTLRLGSLRGHWGALRGHLGSLRGSIT